MIHNFNTRRNNWPEQSLAKVYFQQCFQSWSEAKQIEKYPPQGYCEVFRTTCLRKEVGIQWRVSEKPRQSWPSPAWNYLSVEMAPWQGLLCRVALAALPKTGLEVKLWQFSPCTVLTKPWIRKRDETKVQDSTMAFAASGSCCSAAPGGSEVKLLPLLWLCTKAGVRGQRGSRNNVGRDKSGPPFLCLNCRLGSGKRPESRKVLQIQPHRRHSPDCGELEAFGLHRKFYLWQVNIIQRTLSQAVRETTALKNRELCHSTTNICTDWFWLQTKKSVQPKSPAFSCNHEDAIRMRPAPATARKSQWVLKYFCWKKILVPGTTRKM